MTELAATPNTGASTPLVRFAPLLFGVTVFASAGLVFLVEPMFAKLVLPTLGGTPAVWNTSMAFFQAALLVGYGYAHALQRVRSLKVQTAVHAAVILLAALALPLRVTGVLGQASADHPILWLLGVLAISLGAPFAALSATAPLAQAWYARVTAARGANPYVLYVASNLGSLIALVAYPVLVEPALRLHVQTLVWSLGYAAFLTLMLLVAFVSARAGQGVAALEQTEAAEATRPTWRQRLTWIGLAAIPSSLMLGVTTHITTDVASAPFLWVVPLALYLLSFVIAFSDRRILPPWVIGGLQPAALAGVVWTLGMHPKHLPMMLAVHLVGFFLTAWLCHWRLASKRPDPAHLTEFYMWMSVGGVVGGSFNAFLAPMVFQGVWEYPLVLILSALVWPREKSMPRAWYSVLSTVGLLSVAIAVGVNQAWAYQVIKTPADPMLQTLLSKGPLLLFSLAPLCAFLVREQVVTFALLILAITVGSHNLVMRENLMVQSRSFFGVLRVTRNSIPGYANDVRLLANGTTLHGAQARDAANPCVPLTYYAPTAPIGQVFLETGQRKRNMVVGAVGMGAGTVAAYARPDDEYRFYEIDPLVIALSSQRTYFSYISSCAKARHLDWRVGDARLTLAREKPGVFDVLLVDAFSSDAVPAHLLTVEAMKLYLERLRPDGVVIMHLSNRNLDLIRPVAAVAKAAGGASLIQRYTAPDLGDLRDASEDVIIVGRTAEALAPFAATGRWRPTDARGVAPWTDDYTGLFQAMIRKMKTKYFG